MAGNEKHSEKKDFGSPKEAPKEAPKDIGSNSPQKEIRGIVRVAGKDLKGHIPITRALSKVKGVGERLAPIMAEVSFAKLSIPSSSLVGELSEDQLEKIEEIIANPSKYGIPSFLLNRRKDIETGSDIHLIGTDLSFAVKQDVERDKTIYTWRGFRHTYGQKVRGQRTRSTGRTGMSVGVLRKSIMKAAGPAQAQAQAQAAAPAAGEAKKEVKPKEAPKKE